MDEASTHKAIKTLRKIPVFSGLKGDEYQQLLSVCKIGRYKNGHIIFRENDPSTAMYVLLSGQTKMQANSGGSLFIMKPGDLFGEIGVICQCQRSANAVVSQDAVLLELSQHKFDLLMVKNPTIMAKILRNVAKVLAERLTNNGSHRPIF